MVRPGPRLLLAEAAAAALLLSACGGGESTASQPTGGSAPTSGAPAAEEASPPMTSQTPLGEASDVPASIFQSDLETAQALNCSAPGFAKPKVAAFDLSRDRSSTRQALLAQFGFTVTNQSYTLSAAEYNSFIAGIKSRNPGARIAQYINFPDIGTSAPSTEYDHLLAREVEARGWWLLNGTSKVTWNGGQTYVVNPTSWAPTNPSGQRFPQFKAQHDFNGYLNGRNVDYVFTANTWGHPRVTGSWRSNGANQSATDSTVQAATRAGYAAYWTALRARKSSIKIMGGVDTTSDLSQAEFRGALDGALLDGLIGRAWSIETTRGWAAALATYRSAIANTRGDKTVIFSAYGTSATDYQTMRYGLASSLMDNGWYNFRPWGTAAVTWYDEYSAPLGNATDAPPTAPFSNGVWRRRFDNGLVLVNPTNAVVTVDVGSGYKRLSGTQDPSVNNGQTQSSVTLPARSGLIMVKTCATTGAPAPAPAPAPSPSPSPSPAPSPSPSPAPSPAPAPSPSPTPAPAPTPSPSPAPAPAPGPTSTLDAVRLAHQASFGPTEALVSQIRTDGPAAWIAAQMQRRDSRYTRGNGDAVHKFTGSGEFCNQAGMGSNCWRDWFSSHPLVWDFYRNAVGQPDQLRQRMAYALQQILVISNLEVHGTYGWRNYYNALLDNAFGNYRQVLKKVTLSPLMGDYLNHVNNDKAAPNENFARELLQLFSIGTCELQPDGTLTGGQCRPTYDNARVRSYAYALTGWTYPAGGATPWGCWPAGTNCRYYGGDMVPLPALHETAALSLLGGVSVPANSTPALALERVLDSLMQHPNMAPFVGRQLIQHLVTSNPSPAYVARVSAAFNSGVHGAGGRNFGTGQRGDLAATVAAVLLDPEARNPSPGNDAGKLREPALLFTGTLRALGGTTDGEPYAWWWGETLQQHLFRPPSVFNFYPPDYPVPGTDLVAPGFGIHSANSALERLNVLTYLLMWNGSTPDASVPGAVGTRVNLQPFDADAVDAGRLVDRLSVLAVGGPLPSAARQEIVSAVEVITSRNAGTTWQRERVRQAAYLVFATPDYHVQR